MLHVRERSEIVLHVIVAFQIGTRGAEAKMEASALALPGHSTALVGAMGAMLPPSPPFATRSDLWALGVVYTLLSTLMGTVGKDFFRLAFVTSNPTFHAVGIVLSVVLDPVFNLIALSFATQAIVSACAGFVIVWNALLAPFMLGESLTRIRLISSTLILVGTIGVGASGPHYEVVRTEREYMALLSDHSAVVYYVLLLAWCSFAFWRWRRDPLGVGRPWGAVLGGSIAGNNFFVKVFLAINYCAIDRYSIGCIHANPWVSWQIYAVGLAALAAAGGGLLVLAVTLRHAEALDGVTIFTGVQIIFAALTSNIVLLENQVTRGWVITIYCFSVGIILVGLTLLAIRDVKYPLELEDEPVEWYARFVDHTRAKALDLWWRLRGVELHLEEGKGAPAAGGSGGSSSSSSGGRSGAPVEGTKLLASEAGDSGTHVARGCAVQ